MHASPLFGSGGSRSRTASTAAGDKPSTEDAAVAVEGLAQRLLHVAGSAGKRDIDTASCGGTGLDTSLEVGHVDHTHVAGAVVDATLDDKLRAGGGGVGRAV